MSRPQTRSKGLLEELDSLAHCGVSPDGVADRTADTLSGRQARRLVEDQMRQSSLNVSLYRVGSGTCSYLGQFPELPALAIGSHADTVPHGDRYDGMRLQGKVVTAVSAGRSAFSEREILAEQGSERFVRPDKRNQRPHGCQARR